MAKRADIQNVERRIARRYLTDSDVEIWVAKKGVLGRLRALELPVADLSMFGASVYADLSEKLSKGQVVEVAIGGEKTAAIIRSERPGEHGGEQRRYGIEFIKPTDAFLSAVRNITETYRHDQGEAVSSEQLWLRSG